MKIKAYLFLFLSVSLLACGQEFPYGNNVDAGQYQKIRGIRMYYEIYGEGPPLLLLHGNGGSVGAFSKNIPYFSQKYRVIAVDSRAQGKTVDLGDSLSFEMMADDFAALLTTLGVDSAYVIGWSDGGINALLLAMRHPEKVKKLVSSGANVSPDSTAILPDLWREDQLFYEQNKNKVFRNVKEKNNFKVFSLDVLEPNIPLKELQKIKVPALIVAGDRDLIVREHTVAISKNIPNARLWIVPNSGHGTLIEHADEFNRVVDDFFQN